LKTPPYQGREVLFVGFANSANGDQAAIDTSAQVAATMRSAFTQFAPDVVLNNRLKLSSMGFGSVAPVTCYSGQVSSSTYSRVEIWLR
jgi:phosphate transport system substrate-binding protein